MIHFLHTFQPSPLLLAIGPFIIRWYGVTIAGGAVAGYFALRALVRRIGWSSDAALTLAVTLLLGGFVGARLYHVLNEPAYYGAHPLEILFVWHGGLAIHGGLIAGALILWWYARRWKTSILLLTDLAAPAVAIGQAIGRWGNYFNQELFGRPTNLPWGIPIDVAYRPEGFTNAPFFHPTFLYESLWEILVFLFLILLFRRLHRVDRIGKTGIITFAYLGLASLGRLMTELLRIDQTPHVLGIRLPLLVSGCLIIVALGGLWYCVRRQVTSNPS